MKLRKQNELYGWPCDFRQAAGFEGEIRQVMFGKSNPETAYWRSDAIIDDTSELLFYEHEDKEKSLKGLIEKLKDKKFNNN